jgi:hypothetical protein
MAIAEAGALAADCLRRCGRIGVVARRPNPVSTKRRFVHIFGYRNVSTALIFLQTFIAFQADGQGNDQLEY